MKLWEAIKAMQEGQVVADKMGTLRAIHGGKVVVWYHEHWTTSGIDAEALLKKEPFEVVSPPIIHVPWDKAWEALKAGKRVRPVGGHWLWLKNDYICYMCSAGYPVPVKAGETFINKQDGLWEIEP